MSVTCQGKIGLASPRGGKGGAPIFSALQPVTGRAQQGHFLHLSAVVCVEAERRWLATIAIMRALASAAGRRGGGRTNTHIRTPTHTHQLAYRVNLGCVSLISKESVTIRSSTQHGHDVKVATNRSEKQTGFSRSSAHVETASIFLRQSSITCHCYHHKLASVAS